ncbi:hypothetical protein OKW38_001305 [Paraburkholderia sp. MM5496-R1]
MVDWFGACMGRNRQNRAAGTAQHVLGDAAEHQSLNTTAAVRAHHNRVGVPFERRRDDALRDVFARCRGFHRAWLVAHRQSAVTERGDTGVSPLSNGIYGPARRDY